MSIECVYYNRVPKATGKAAAERLRAALLLQRRGAADELQAIRDLAVDYDIEVDDDLIDELLVVTPERTFALGDVARE